MDVDRPPGVDVRAAVADHHHAVAEHPECRPQLVGARFVGVGQRVHHLVARAAPDALGVAGPTGCRAAGPAVSTGCRDRGRRGGGLGRREVLRPLGRLSREHLDHRVEQDEQAPAAGVDHPGTAKRRQLRGGAVQGLRTGVRRRAGHLDQRVGRGATRRRGGLAQDRHDGSLHGVAQRVVDERDRRAQGPAVGRGVDDGEGRRLTDRTEHLGQDHPGVAARPVDRAVAERDRDLAGARRAAALGDPRVLTLRTVHGRAHRVEQVCPGVRIGHREDVEGVDLLAMEGEHLDRPPRPREQSVRVEGRRTVLDMCRLLRHHPSSPHDHPCGATPGRRGQA